MSNMEIPKFKSQIILGKGVVKDVLKLLLENHDDECFYCGCKITEENFGAITKETGLVCNNIVCALEFFADYAQADKDTKTR